MDAALTRLKPRLEHYLARAESLLMRVGSADPPLDARLLQCALNGLAQALVTGAAFIEEGGPLLPVEPLRARLTAIFSRNDHR